jgi:18S rRNA (guanine1575-N7)-methyltransferase
MSRPELVNPPDIFYDDDEAHKYAQNSRMIKIQRQMSERAVELLSLPKNKSCLLLDVGCGSGLSGEVLSDQGHYWIGTDIAASMLGVAVEREVEGDCILHDMGQGLCFRPGCFDGAISISALQWLCNADHARHVPQKRLKVFFQSLYNCLASGARAVFQFYPASTAQMSMITEAAMKCGFSGGLVVDYPNSKKAKKYFLCLFAGESGAAAIAADIEAKNGLGAGGGGDSDDDDDGEQKEGDEDDEDMEAYNFVDGKKGAVAAAAPGKKRKFDGDDDDEEDGSAQPGTVMFTQPSKQYSRVRGKNRGSAPVKSRQWVLQKKERAKNEGRKTAGDSKFTARKRGPRF